MKETDTKILVTHKGLNQLNFVEALQKIGWKASTTFFMENQHHKGVQISDEAFLLEQVSQVQTESISGQIFKLAERNETDAVTIDLLEGWNPGELISRFEKKGIKIIRTGTTVFENHFSAAQNNKTQSVFVESDRELNFPVLVDCAGEAKLLPAMETIVQHGTFQLITEVSAQNQDQQIQSTVESFVKKYLKQIPYPGVWIFRCIVQDNSLILRQIDNLIDTSLRSFELLSGLDLFSFHIRLSIGESTAVLPEFAQNRKHVLCATIRTLDTDLNNKINYGVIKSIAHPIGNNIRILSTLLTGKLNVTLNHPEISCVFVVGETRHEVVNMLNQALRHVVIVGIDTNISMLFLSLAHLTDPARRKNDHRLQKGILQIPLDLSDHKTADENKIAAIIAAVTRYLEDCHISYKESGRHPVSQTLWNVASRLTRS